MSEDYIVSMRLDSPKRMIHTTKPVRSDTQDEGRAKKFNGAEEGRHGPQGDTAFAHHGEGSLRGLVKQSAEWKFSVMVKRNVETAKD